MQVIVDDGLLAIHTAPTEHVAQPISDCHRVPGTGRRDLARLFEREPRDIAAAFVQGFVLLLTLLCTHKLAVRTRAPFIAGPMRTSCAAFSAASFAFFSSSLAFFALSAGFGGFGGIALE